MKMRLSTLLLVVAIIGLAIGWFVDRRTYTVDVKHTLDVQTTWSYLIGDACRTAEFYHREKTTKYLGNRDFILLDCFERLTIHYCEFAEDIASYENWETEPERIRDIGGRLLKLRGLTDIEDFKNNLSNFTSAQQQQFNWYNVDGTLREDVVRFVKECFSSDAYLREDDF